MIFTDKIFKTQKYNPLETELINEFNLHRTCGTRDLLCYVPFRMMYFAFNGDIISCCHNRKNILGKYPEQSIKSIWFGKKINKLRKFIRANDLDYGCAVCKDQIISKNFSAVKSKMYDHYPVPDNKYPAVMEFELDNTCNLECIMCTGVFCSLIRKNREKKDVLKSPYDNKFVGQLIKFIPHLEEAKFYGGEPLLIKIYYDIWKKMIEINPSIRILIQTNGTILNAKVREILNKGFFNINVSIDSVDKQNFESIRKNAMFEEVMENIKFFRDYCSKKGTFFSIIVTPIRQNWSNLPSIIEFCNNLNVPVYFNTLFYPYINALWNLPPEELSKIFSTLSEFNFPENTLLEVQNKNVLSDFLNQVSAWKIESASRCLEKHKNLNIMLETLDEAKEIFYNNLYVRFSKDFKKNIEKISWKISEYETRINSHLDKLIPLRFDKIIYLELNKLKMDDMLHVLDNDTFDDIIQDTLNTYNEIENNNYCL